MTKPIIIRFNPSVIIRTILIRIIHACFSPRKKKANIPNNIIHGTVPNDQKSIVSIPFTALPDKTANSHILLDDAHGNNAVRIPAKNGPLCCTQDFFCLTSHKDGIPVRVKIILFAFMENNNFFPMAPNTPPSNTAIPGVLL